MVNQSQTRARLFNQRIFALKKRPQDQSSTKPSESGCAWDSSGIQQKRQGRVYVAGSFGKQLNMNCERIGGMPQKDNAVACFRKQVRRIRIDSASGGKKKKTSISGLNSFQPGKRSSLDLSKSHRLTLSNLPRWWYEKI